MRLLALAVLLAFLAYLLHRPTRAPRLIERPTVPEDVYVLSLWERSRAA